MAVPQGKAIRTAAIVRFIRIMASARAFRAALDDGREESCEFVEALLDARRVEELAIAPSVRLPVLQPEDGCGDIRLPAGSGWLDDPARFILHGRPRRFPDRHLIEGLGDLGVRPLPSRTLGPAKIQAT